LENCGPQLEGAAERRHSLVELAGLGEQLAQAVVAQLVLRVVGGHLAELLDAVLQLAHARLLRRAARHLISITVRGMEIGVVFLATASVTST